MRMLSLSLVLFAGIWLFRTPNMAYAAPATLEDVLEKRTEVRYEEVKLRILLRQEAALKRGGGLGRKARAEEAAKISKAIDLQGDRLLEAADVEEAAKAVMDKAVAAGEPAAAEALAWKKAKDQHALVYKNFETMKEVFLDYLEDIDDMVAKINKERDAISKAVEKTRERIAKGQKQVGVLLAKK